MKEKYGCEVYPYKPVYYFLSKSKSLVIGPFLTRELAEERRFLILDKENWEILSGWQG